MYDEGQAERVHIIMIYIQQAWTSVNSEAWFCSQSINLENFLWLFLSVRIVISRRCLIFYAYFPVYFLDDSGCKCGCLASGYSEPLSAQMIGHWSELIPNDSSCLLSPPLAPRPGSRLRLTTNSRRQTKTRTRDNLRRHHLTLLILFVCNLRIFFLLHCEFDNRSSRRSLPHPAPCYLCPLIYSISIFRRVPLETSKGSRQCLQNMQPGSYLTLDRRSRNRRKGRDR